MQELLTVEGLLGLQHAWLPGWYYGRTPAEVRIRGFSTNDWFAPPWEQVLAACLRLNGTGAIGPVLSFFGHLLFSSFLFIHQLGYLFVIKIKWFSKGSIFWLTFSHGPTHIWFYFNHIFVFNPNMSSALFHPFSLTLYLIRCSPYKGAQHLKCETTETFVFLQLAIKFFGGCNHLQIQGVFF